ncbi:MAG: hypothetical protein V3V28_00720 [Polaribacter sp.]|uniref:hypothetical protein n=1 Tax=Polaribacter sp. TaxID=1920175 RepID=UPI002F355D34
MKTIFKIENLKRILLSTFLGYLIGLIISYINLFGSSQDAPLMCAFGATAVAVVSLKNKKLDLLYKGKIK